MILKKKKLIFVHVPKTGGTSVEFALCPDGKFPDWGFNKKRGYQQHSTLKQLLDYGMINKKELKEFYKFSFVRNPYDRILSLYFFMHKLPNYKDKMKEVSFKEFIKKNLAFREGNYPEWNDDLELKAMIKDQKDFFLEYEVDFIGKFENFQEDFNKICDAIKSKRILLKKINHTMHKHYSSYYDKETVELVTQLYKADLVKFNYKFEKKPLLYNLVNYYFPYYLGGFAQKTYVYSDKLRKKFPKYDKLLDKTKTFLKIA